MIKWLRNKLASPLLPILIQTHKVTLLISVNLETVIKYLVDGGVAIDSPIYNNVAKVLSAFKVVNEALSRIILALGGEPFVTQSVLNETISLDSELEKLKNLL